MQRARGGGGGDRAGAAAAGVELAEQSAKTLQAGGDEEGDGAKEVAQGCQQCQGLLGTYLLSSNI
jgi:hypothetical protein